MSIAENVAKILADIETAAVAAGRDPKEITLCAATKMNDAARVREAIAAGVRCCGENRVQELLSKYEQIDKSAKIHLIGQLQTNKVKYIIDKVSLVHSLDRLSLAKELDAQAKNRLNAPIEALVEVNIGSETTKCGVLPENLTEYLDILRDFMYIKPRGLMTVAPAMATEAELDMYFTKMQQLLQDTQKAFGSEFNILSMGMSRDYATAIKHGSTMIRLGTALFGERDYNRGI
mgnify:CR=1 FL=1